MTLDTIIMKVLELEEKLEQLDNELKSIYDRVEMIEKLASATASLAHLHAEDTKQTLYLLTSASRTMVPFGWGKIVVTIGGISLTEGETISTKTLLEALREKEKKIIREVNETLKWTNEKAVPEAKRIRREARKIMGTIDAIREILKVREVRE